MAKAVPIPVPIVIPTGQGNLSTNQTVFVIVSAVVIISALAGMLAYWWHRG